MAIEYLIYGLSPLFAYYLVTRKNLGPIPFLLVLILALLLMCPLWFTDYVYSYYIFEFLCRFLLLLSTACLIFYKFKSLKYFLNAAYSFIAVSIILSLLITGVLFFAKAMGTTSTIIKEWNTDNYKITHYSSIAWAGPPTEHIYLKEYKVGGLLNKTLGYLYQSDIPDEEDCNIEFTNYIFDKCTNTVTKKDE